MEEEEISLYQQLVQQQVRKGLLRTGGGSSSQILRSGGITGHRRHIPGILTSNIRQLSRHCGLMAD
jgi:hypothetical protein